MILPLAPIFILSLRPAPISALCTNLRASSRGRPTWLVNSCGAAPVPPSPPSMTMKSGVTLVSIIAFNRAMNS